MTDQVPSSDPPNSSNQTIRSQPQPVQLKFPTIDLKTSLESLLSHSTPTASEASTIMAPGPSPQPALDESWASLDVSDFSHDDEDDDTQSVNTDVGSLVDLSSVRDIESAVEDDSESEVDVDEERMTEQLTRGVSRHSEQVGQPDQHNMSTHGAMEDTVIFQQSAIQSSSSAIDMDYIRHLLSPSGQKTSAQETITMAISPNDLKPFDAPVRIAYYGSRYPPANKDELLGKIGAALITPLPNSSSRISTSSTCFNIVPTEFGPGSKPAFADLIPSQAQMTIDDISAVVSSPDRPDAIRFVLGKGTVVDSDLADLAEQVDCREFQPDLLVIHLGQEDYDEGFDQLASLQLLAARHHWPTIIVAEDASCTPLELYQVSKQYGIQVNSEGDGHSNDHRTRRPIDLDTFMTMDTVQLSRHIMHIMETRSASLDKADAAAKPQNSFVDNIRHLLSAAKTRRYVLRVADTKTEGSLDKTTKQSFPDQAKQAWSTIKGRQHVKDTLFTLIATMLAVCVVVFSQNLASRANGLVVQDDATITAIKAEGTATVTATSAITTSVNTPVALISQDVAIEDTLQFGQLWQQFTGRLMPEQEVDKAPNEVEEEKLTHDSIDMAESSPSVDEKIHQIVDWLQLKVDTIRDRAARRTAHKSLTHSGKVSKRVEARELHRKLQDLYEDAKINVQKLSLSKRREFQSLIARSHHHLKQTRWAGERKLERLVEDQKILLSQAQHQAKHIVAAKKKRRSIFGRK